MRAIILAAGRGMRLQQAAGRQMPKALLPFDGLTLLERHLRLEQAEAEYRQGQGEQRGSHRRKVRPHDLQAGADTRLGRPEGHVESASHLFVGHVFEKGQRDSLALLGRQRRESGFDDMFVLVLPGTLFGAGVPVGDALQRVVGFVSTGGRRLRQR